MARSPRAFRSACCARDSCLRGCRPTACPARSWSRACNRGLEGRLLAVVAGAGYGKTTLLVQALESSPLPWVWLSCDPRLRTPEMLLAHVAAGVAGAFPGVATALPPGGSPDDQIAALANEIVVTIPDDFVLALDDVHALDPGPVRDTLGRLASDLPPNVHLAITGRRDLGIPTSRAAAGGATVIDEGMLAFSFSEAAELLEDAPGELLETEIGELHQRTEGWVSGLLLATRSGGGAGRAPHVSTAGPHFDYLADEVLAGLPEELQRFLLDTSVLERFTPPLAAAVSERPDARDVLRDLVASHLFIVQAEGDWYRYHHLFGAFLRRRLAEREPGAAGGAPRARRPGVGGGRRQPGGGAALPGGRRARRGGPAPWSPWPSRWWPRRSARPWPAGSSASPRRSGARRLQLAHALLTYLGGDARAAFEAWDEAIDRLMEAGEVERAAGALYRSQLAMLTVGVSPAVRVALAERHLPRLDGAGPAGGLARMIVAVAYAIGGKRAEAEELIGAALAAAGRRELALLDPCAEMVRGFYFDYADGHLDEALRRIEDGLSRLEPIEVEESFMLQAFGRGNRALILADTGRYEDCLREAQSVLDLSASLGMRSAPSLLILWWRLLSLCGLGDWEGVTALEAEARRAIGAGTGTNVAYRMGAQLARAAAARGDVEAALARIAAARAALRDYGDSYEIPMVLGELALAADAAGQAALGRELAEEAVATAERLQLDWFRARAALLSASMHIETPLGDARLEEALELTERLGLGVLWRRRERPRAGALLARALQAGLPGAPAAARLAAECGREVLHECVERLSDPAARARLADAMGDDTDVDPETIRLLLDDPDPGVASATERVRELLERRPRQPIRIETFGGLRLYRAGDRVPDSSFGRAKARALMGALVCAEPRGVHRDRLLEHLWPELPPERGDARPRHHAPRAAPHARAAGAAALGRLAGAPRGRGLPAGPGGAGLLGRRRLPAAGPGGGGRARRRGAGAHAPRGGALARGLPARLPLRALGRGRAPRAGAGAAGAARAPGAHAGRDGASGGRDRALPPPGGAGRRARGLAPRPDARLRPGRRAAPGPAPVPRLPGHPALAPRASSPSAETRELYSSLL